VVRSDVSIDRARKLLALAADRSGTPEGETAARLARTLLLRHGRRMAGLNEAERGAVDPFARRRLALGGPEHWRRRLLSLVAGHCACVATWRADAGWLHGRRSAVAVAEYLFVVLTRAIGEERARYEREGGGRPADFTRSALLALEVRLRELRSGEDLGSTALVRAHAAGVEGWMATLGIRPRQDAPFPYAFEPEGYEAGRRLPLVGALE
jgi:hypothetical protein